MKYPYLAKYTNEGIKKTIAQLHERTDLSDEEKERRGNIMIAELESRGLNPVQEVIDELAKAVDKFTKKLK